MARARERRGDARGPAVRGPRGGAILCRQDLARKIDTSVFPGLQGGPLDHAIAAKAVAFHEALQPEYRTYQAQVVANCKALTLQPGGTLLQTLLGPVQGC